MRSNKRLAASVAAFLVLAAVAAALLLRPATPPAELDQAALEATLEDVLEGVYAAFAEADEARVYDGLERVVAGDLVADLYLQRRTAQVAVAGEDAGSEVLSVEPTRIVAEPLPDTGGYRIDAAWRVVGRIRHAAHVHERINLYAADLDLALVEGRWKLAAFTLNDIDRAEDFTFEGGE